MNDTYDIARRFPKCAYRGVENLSFNACAPNAPSATPRQAIIAPKPSKISICCSPIFAQAQFLYILHPTQGQFY